MIYTAVEENAAIRQGDIFRAIPFVEMSLGRLPIIDENDEPREEDWDLLAVEAASSPIAAILPVRSVYGIVITQNCDAGRANRISLALVDTCITVTNNKTPPTSPKKWQSWIVSKSRENLKWFYLPADHPFGFRERMAADFQSLIQVPRLELEQRKHNRMGALNEVASEHFRETLAQFFRRYPYDEWYPLTKEEFDEYKTGCPEVPTPFPWQVRD